ncbi:MAG TPA: hypothetical protein VGN16_13385 [Acidobacteriaceae bacterium]
MSLVLTLLIGVPSNAFARASAKPIHPQEEKVATSKDWGPLNVDRLVFFHGAIFAGSNAGVIEITDQEKTQFRFHRSDDVVTGPWLDRATDRLWFSDEHDGDLIYLDRKGWKKVPLPLPSSRRLTRADVLKGLSITSTSEGSFMAWAGSGWKWSEAMEQWMPIPELSKKMRVIGLLPIGDHLFVLENRQTAPYDPQITPTVTDRIFRIDGSSAIAVPAQVEPFLTGTWEAATFGAVICTADRRLLRVSDTHITQVTGLSGCNSLGTTDSGNVLAAFENGQVWEIGPATEKIVSRIDVSSGPCEAHVAMADGFVAISSSKAQSNGNECRDVIARQSLTAPSLP